MRFRLFNLLPLFLIIANSSAQTIVSFHLDHRMNGARLYASVLGEGDEATQSLIRRLKVDDVGELKAADELSAPSLHSVSLDSSAGLEIRLDVPGRLTIVRNAPASRLEMKTYSTETMNKVPLSITTDPHLVTIRSPEPTHLCAMSLVNERLLSMVGTCTEATLYLAPGDQVRVYLEGVLQ